MIGLTNDLKEAAGLNPHKHYEAVVVDDDDPKRWCRVRARVPGMCDGIPDEDLPWAIPLGFNHLRGASSKSCSISIPKKGTKVLLKFQDGKPTKPTYSGYVVDQTTVPEEIKHNYPFRSLWRLENKFMVVVDEKTNEVFIRNPGNFNVYIQGNVDLTVVGNLTERIDGSVHRHIKGDVTETIDGSYKRNIKGNRDETINGSSKYFVQGADGQHSGTSMERTAPYINDDMPKSGPSAAAPRPEIPVWPGIPGGAKG